MATSVALEEGFEIPWVGSLGEFRTWVRSDDFPERGRIDYLAGRIEVDRTPEDYYTHGGLKVEVVGVLGNLVKADDLGDLRADRTRISTPEADLSVEPDLVFIAHETFESGRARLVPKVTEEADRYVEVEGPPDLVVEIVSDRSVTKDTVRLPAAYWRAGIAEYWLMDARGERLVFRIQRRGPSGYEPAPVDAEGFQHSGVFHRWFRLARRRGRRDGWTFDLEHKPAE
jgi:Uma2 family endonuclease